MKKIFDLLNLIALIAFVISEIFKQLLSNTKETLTTLIKEKPVRISYLTTSVLALVLLLILFLCPAKRDFVENILGGTASVTLLLVVAAELSGNNKRLQSNPEFEVDKDFEDTENDLVYVGNYQHNITEDKTITDNAIEYVPNGIPHAIVITGH